MRRPHRRPYVHFHALVVDGVYAPHGADGRPRFLPARRLGRWELGDVLRAVRVRIVGLLRLRGG